MSTCGICGQSFADKKGLRSHKKAKHPTPRRCPQCSSVFPSKKSLRKHIAAEHPQRCAACGKSFGSKSALQSHRRDKHLPMRNNGTGAVQPITSTVQNPPQLEYKCDQCPVVFHSLKNLNRHQRKVHRFKCNHCNRTFIDIAGRSSHEAAKHPTTYKYGQDQYQTSHLNTYCGSCNLIFPTSEALREHSRDRHDLYCRYCSCYFATVGLRDQHEYLTHKSDSCQVVESLQRYSESSHSLCWQQSLPLASTSHTFVPSSPSNNSSSSVVDYSSSSSLSALPRTLHQSDPSSDSDTEQESESQPASESLMSVETDLELDENVSYAVDVSPAMSDAHGALETDSNCAMSDVRSGPNAIGPDEHQAVYNYPSCRWMFESDEDLQIHERISSQIQEIPIHCQYCYSQFEDEISFQQHLTKRASLSCGMCNLHFCYDFILYDHIGTHPTCQRCGQTFPNEPELYRHTEHQHPVVVCWDCEGAIVSEDSLDVHYALEHPSCTVCGVRMRTPRALLEHINKKHPEEKHAISKHLLDPNHALDTQDIPDFRWNGSPIRNTITGMGWDNAKPLESDILEHPGRTFDDAKTEENVRDLHVLSHFDPGIGIGNDGNEMPPGRTFDDAEIETEESVHGPHVLGHFDPGIGNDDNETFMGTGVEVGQSFDLLPIHPMLILSASFILSLVSFFFP